MAGLFLPQKQDYEVQYSLETPGTYTWTAPDAENAGGGDQYELTIQMWGAGSGGAATATHYYPSGYGGGSGGAYTIAVVKVLAGTVYTFTVGNGGAAAPGFGNPAGGYQGFPATGYAGGAGGVSRISDGSGAIITAGGGATQIFTSSTYYSKDYPTSGAGGSTSIGQAGKVTSYSNVSGAQGGSGLRQPGLSVLAQLGEPGGAGGAAGGGNTYNNRVGCGGGASVRANGGRGGNSGGSNSSNAGGTGSGGGGGYHPGANGVDGATGGSSSSVNSSFTGGGKGGNGRISFSFMVSNGGSPGIAPA